jgi:tetratricopeptide (TPR) repeat protein
MGSVEESLESTRRALVINQRLMEVGMEREDVLSEIATNHATLGVSHARLEQLPEAVAQFRKSVEIREMLATRNPEDIRARRQLMIAYSHLGDALGAPTRSNLNDTRGALEVLAKMLRIAEQLATQDENDRRVRMDLMFSLQRVANVMSRADGPAALQQFRRALRIGEEILAVDARNSTLRLNIAFVLDRIASIEEASGAIVPALAVWRRAVGIADELLAEDPADQDVRLLYLDAAGKYAVAQARTGNRAEALQFPEKLERLALELGKSSAQDRRHLAQIPLARQRAGEVFELLSRKEVSPETQRRDAQASIEWYRKSRDSWEPLVRTGQISMLYAAEPARVAERLGVLTTGR